MNETKTNENDPLTRRTLSAAAEDYLKAIFGIQRENQHASTNRVAEAMKASPAAASKMLKQLASLGLLEYRPYYGGRLTAPGEKIAIEIVRHHRLLEAYLHQVVGYGWDEVDAEAEKLEHHISEGFEDRIDSILNFPQFDPHGHPIPDRSGAIAPLRGRPLSAFSPGDHVLLVRVSDDDPHLLRFLSDNEIHLHAQLEVIGTETQAAPEYILRVKNNRTQTESDCTLPSDDARHVFVELCDSAAAHSLKKETFTK